MKNFCTATFVSLFAVVAAGCSSSAPPQTGFLSEYSNLKENDGAMRYVSPKMNQYTAFIIDPVQMSAAEKLSDTEKAEVAAYFTKTFSEDLTKRGYRVVNAAGDGVARVRLAITSIQESKWYMNLHPASKLTGAGTGGASMEGEIVDSTSSEQLAAVIQAGKGNQFELDTFSKLDDVKDAINKWVETAGARLDQLRAGV